MFGSSLYKRFLITLILLGTALVLFMLAVVGIGTDRRTADLIFTKDAELLEQIAYSSQFVDNVAKTFTMSLFTDDITAELFGVEFPDLRETVLLMNEVKAKVNAFSAIHSVYIYDEDHGWLYSTNRNARQEIGDTLDRGISDIILAGNMPGRLSAVPRTIASSGQSPRFPAENVFTYILPTNRYDKGGFPSALIVNLKADFLMETIKRLSRESESSVIVFDDQARVIGHEDPTLFREQLTGDYLEAIKNLESSGQGAITLDGRRFLASLVHQPDTGWWFLKTTPYREVAAILRGQRILLLIIAAVFLAIAVLLSVLFSRRLYQPIRGLVHHVERLAPPTEGLNHDELSFVTEAFSEAMEKVRSLSALRGESIPSLTAQKVRKALLGVPGGIEELHTLLLEEGKTSRLRVMLLHPDLGEEAEIKSALLGGLRFVVFEGDAIVRSEEGSGFSITTDEGDVAVLGTSDEILETIRLRYEDRIADLRGWTVSTAYSSDSSSVEDVPRLYQEAMELIEYRFVFGPGSLLHLETVDERLDESVPFPANEEKVMIDALREGREEEAIETYNEISAIISRYSYDAMRRGFARVASSIFDFLNLSVAIPPRDPRFRYLDFTSRLGRCRYLSTVDELMKELITSVIEALQENVGDKTRDKVRAAQDYVHHSYTDPNINLAETASALKMSAVYLGRIFKKATGLSFNAYLTKVRLEEAAQRLRETSEKVETVSMKVGVSNTRFFVTKFKEAYGTTPSGYRSAVED